MSQRVIEELQMGQQILREEVRQLRTQLDLVMQLLTRREGSRPSYQPPMYSVPQTIPSRETPPQQPRRRHQKQKRKFDPIPLSYSQLLQRLLQSKVINLRNMPPLPKRPPADYNPSTYCEFHSGGIGHGVEDCLALKHKVQDLIDKKQLIFRGGIPLVNGQLLL